MILLCNTFITETPPSIGKGRVERGNLSSFSNFDIFKYSLASLAVAHKWSKVILKILLDDCYKDKQDELEEFIKEEFKNFNLILEWKRNEYQSDWKQTYELLDDNLIWFYCNHDHIFFDSSTKYLDELIESIKDEKLCSIQFSHWPENIRTVKQGLISPATNNFVAPSYKIHDNYVSVDTINFDSIQIITKELYYKWWFEGEFNHIKLPRPDYFGIGLAEIKSMPIHKTIVPLKEICRHFDGYQHINPPITNNQCPAIDIPLGFFKNEIKIKFGFDEYFKDYVNINPLNEYYYADNKLGTDYKFTLEDLPLVWKKRIKFIYSNSNNLDEIQIIENRIKSIMEMIYTNHHYSIDDEVKEKILNKYLETFNYIIEQTNA